MVGSGCQDQGAKFLAVQAVTVGDTSDESLILLRDPDSNARPVFEIVGHVDPIDVFCEDFPHHLLRGA